MKHELRRHNVTIYIVAPQGSASVVVAVAAVFARGGCCRSTTFARPRSGVFAGEFVVHEGSRENAAEKTGERFGRTEGISWG
jgi:hypothetical protein